MSSNFTVGEVRIQRTMSSNLIHFESIVNTVNPPVCVHGEVVQDFGRSKTILFGLGCLFHDKRERVCVGQLGVIRERERESDLSA